MMYLLSLACFTPLRRGIKVLINDNLLVSVKLAFWIKHAFDSKMVSPCIRPLASRVAPVDTRSQIASASPARGATSTEPLA